MRTTRITITAVALLAAVGLAGCAGSNAASEPSATTTVTSTPHPSPTETVTATPTTPATTGTGGTGTGGTGSGTGTGTGAVATCATSNLTGALAGDPQGGSAGHSHFILTLVNHGATCTLQGWPGTSLVGNSGNQLGAAASFVTTSPHATLTLTANGQAHADISVAQAAAYGSACTKTAAKGFRIYPPGQKAALFVDASGNDITACTQTSIKLLTVTALQAG